MNKAFAILTLTVALTLPVGCKSSGSSEESLPQGEPMVFPADTAMAYTPQAADTASRPALRGVDNEAFNVLKEIERNAPEYSARLMRNLDDGFIVVDKGRMKVILYDPEGREVRSYGMGCAKKFGTKHEKGDNRTPEGFFTVEQVYDSTDWLFTDDNGRTSKKKGQFGPRFIRLKIPTTSQIGIHGTCAPWSMGHRTSHGCIRVTNEHILELVNYVEVGMPVIVLPGKRDRAVTRDEGYDIAYFPTDPKYAMSGSESKLKAKEKEEETEKPDSSSNANGVPADSIAASSPVAPTLLPEEKPAKEDPVVPATEPAAPAE